MILGVTGGIGSGKTTVCRFFELLGVPVYYADLEARMLVDRNEMLRNRIKEIFGDDIYLPSGLDRPKMGTIVFSDKDKLARLNAVVHPAVANHFEEWALSNKKFPLLVKEAAILFESGAYKGVDKTLTVLAPTQMRIARIIKRDGLSESQILDRMANQWPDEQKVAKSDFVVYCDEVRMVLPQLLDIYTKIIE